MRVKAAEENSAEFVFAAGTELRKVEYKGERVLSSSMIEKIHEMKCGAGIGFFHRNKSLFKTGDYFLLGKSDQEELQGATYTASVVFTISGYLLIAKFLKDKAPLRTRKEVVNKYFNIDYASTYTHKPAKSVESEIIPAEAIPVEAIAVEQQQAAPAEIRVEAIPVAKIEAEVTEPASVPMLFSFDNHDVRTFVRDGETWFMASDVCNVLGYANSRDAISRHCRGVAKHDTPTTSGIQEMTIIPERDLYRLVMKSKLPSAERFENWVVSEVLPSIRKSGSFSATAIVPDRPQIAFEDPFAVRDFMIAYCDKLAEKDALVAKQAEMIASQKAALVEQAAMIAELQSKAALSDQMLSIVDSFSKVRH